MRRNLLCTLKPLGKRVWRAVISKIEATSKSAVLIRKQAFVIAKFKYQWPRAVQWAAKCRDCERCVFSPWIGFNLREININYYKRGRQWPRRKHKKRGFYLNAETNVVQVGERSWCAKRWIDTRLIFACCQSLQCFRSGDKAAVISEAAFLGCRVTELKNP